MHEDYTMQDKDKGEKKGATVLSILVYRKMRCKEKGPDKKLT